MIPIIDTTAPLSCMGGWCTQREHCALYHAADRRNPVERLCEAGPDGQVPEPVRPVQVLRQGELL